MTLSIKDFFSHIWSHLLKKYLMENVIFCTVEASKNRFNEADLILGKLQKQNKVLFSFKDIFILCNLGNELIIRIYRLHTNSIFLVIFRLL